MNYESFLKLEIEKTLFVEIKDELTLDIEGKPILKRGEYPVLVEDFIEIGKKNMESLTPAMIIDGMLYIIACDYKFKYVDQYIEFFREAKGLENYIIMKINETKKNNIKKALILNSALATIFPKREYKYNKIIFMMNYYEKSNQEFLEKEIVSCLESMTIEYPEFVIPFFHLGKYYVEKDIDRAKVYLRQCLDNVDTMDEANKILFGISCGEKFDEAVECVKNGMGLEALKILIPILNNNPEDLDTKYYIAVAYRQTGNNTKALMYLKELTGFAERPEVYSEIGINLAELKDYEGAVQYFKKALKITPDDSGIICNIGVCQLYMSELEEAKKTFELVMRVNPTDEIAAKWLLALNKEKNPGK